MTGCDALPQNAPVLTIGQCATWACLWEAAAPKVGNVNRGADFEDLTLYDFNASAVAIGPVMERATERPLGRTVLDAVLATQRLVATNTNLGTILLLAPLASIPRNETLTGQIGAYLAGLTPADAHDVYQAIRLAHPGGLGQVDACDVHGPPPDDLLRAMQLAADRDLVARQYVNGFHQVLYEVAPRLCALHADGLPISHAIVRLQLELMSRYPDALIARKCGLAAAQQASHRAQQVLDTWPDGEEVYVRALADFDFWLRSDGHRRNPGTTADLLAAGMFVVLRDGNLLPPQRGDQQAGYQETR